MPRSSILLALIAVLGLGLGAVALTGCGSETADAACTCEKDAAAEAGWCEKCGVGYIKGEKTECKGCVESAADGAAPCAACAKKGVEKGALRETGGSVLADRSGGTPEASGEKCAGKCAGGDCKGCKDCACAKKGAAGSEKVACVCERGKAGEPVWCVACDKGYVNGEPAGCKGCVAKAKKALAKTSSPD